MNIIKRDGSLQEVSFDKILKRIQSLCDVSKPSTGSLRGSSLIDQHQYNIEPLPAVASVQITQEVIKVLYDRITTRELDEEAARVAQNKSFVHPDYAKLASRIIISNFHKNTHVALNEHFKTTVEKNLFKYVCELLYFNTNFDSSSIAHVNVIKAPLINTELYLYVCANANWIESVLDYSLDYTYDYFGFKMLEDKYLMKPVVNTHNGEERVVIERPQHMNMRVALGIILGHSYNEKSIANMILSPEEIISIDLTNYVFTNTQKAAIVELYNAIANKYYTHATPTLFNAGTMKPQLSSCFLIALPEDSLEGFFDFYKQCSVISKHAGGVGGHIHNIRSRGAYIKGTGGTANGAVQMLKVSNALSVLFDQGGGRRPGSVAIYIEPHHADIYDFLDLKRKEGIESQRARDLFYAMWIPDRFMQAVESDSDWYLMCPNTAPGLSDCYGDEFSKLYDSYIERKMYKKVVKARDLFRKILDCQIENGVPYILFKDACNKRSNQKHSGVIKSSNLCCEILLISNKDETGVCNLASICLPKFVNCETQKCKIAKCVIGTDEIVKCDIGKCEFDIIEPYLQIDYVSLRKYVAIATKSLNKLIDINFYPTVQGKTSNLRHRPLGIGVQGLADVYAELMIPFDSQEARKVNFYIFESMYYAALDASVELAREEGPYETFADSPTSKGILQFDMWMADGYKLPFDLSLDWTSLKARIVKYGLRNSLLIALMPTASTADITGNSPCFEPYQSNIYVRKNQSGDFTIINKYLVKYLIGRSAWTSRVRNWILARNGFLSAVVNDPDCPKDIVELLQPVVDIFKTAFEIDSSVIIQQAHDRGFFIDQTQSMNLFFANATPKALSGALFSAWKSGLKTGSYYIRSRPAQDAIKFTIGDKLETCASCSS
jgi:ribonucleoside-diphosphate reductase alpha chain